MLKVISLSAACLFAANAFAGPVNVNTADADTLAAELNGVGPIVASRIVELRSAKGGFSSAAELMEVRGIGERTVAKNADFILLK